MIVISGPAKSGKTRALATLCMADPNGVFVPSMADTYHRIGTLFPGIKFNTLANVGPKTKFYVDEPVSHNWRAVVDSIAVITSRVEVSS